MHDSEQEHSSITGCRVTYESTIFYNEANKFSIIVVKTSDPRIPPQACNGRYYGDRMLRFTAVGYELPRTKAVELELDGEWVESKYGYQLQVEQWQEIVPQTADGLLAYLGSGLIKGIGPKTAEDIVATFGPDTLNILDNEPEQLLQIRGITEGKLKDIEESYAESRVLRNLMSLLGPFKITPATALKIYQHFGPACVDILKKCPYDLCQISGFGFKRVDGIVRKTDNRLHSTERISYGTLTLQLCKGVSEKIMEKKKSSFSGQIGFVLAAAGSAVGVGNLWRFPHLAAKDGGGLFLLVYLVLVLTFGFTLLTSDIAIGRRTKESAIGAYTKISPKWKFLGILTFLVPVLIMTYYAVIGGWVTKYAVVYLTGQTEAAAADGYFTSFITSPVAPVVFALLFMGVTAFIVYNGVEGGIERVSRYMMPILLVLVVVIAGYSLTLHHTGADGETRTGVQGFCIT